MPTSNPYTPANPFSRSNNGVPGSLRGIVRTNQIIAFALIQGVVVITTILLVLAWDDINFANPLMVRGNSGVLLIVGLMAGLVANVLAPVFYSVLTHRAIDDYTTQLQNHSEIDNDATHKNLSRKFLAGIGTAMLVAMAILEGVCVINAVFLMISGSVLHIVIIAVTVIAMCYFVPTMRSWGGLLEQASR